MLSFFKSNNPGVVVFYIFYLAAFRLYALFGPLDANLFTGHSEPLTRASYSVLTALHATGVLPGLIFSGMLSFVQALLMNKLANDNKILPRKNYLAGLLYIIVISFFKEGLLLSPPMLALTFVILAAIRLFALIHKEKAAGDIFDVGFLVAVATLFYFPCIILVLFVIFGIATVRHFELKEWVVAFIGFTTPFFLAFTWYFWHDETGFLMRNIASLQQGRWLTGASMSRVDAIVLGGVAVLTLLALAILPAALYSSLIQVRKYANILIVLMVLIVIAFFLQQKVNLSHWVLLALPLSVIFSIALVQMRRKAISELLHLMLILLVLTGQYLPLLNIV